MQREEAVKTVIPRILKPSTIGRCEVVPKKITSLGRVTVVFPPIHQKKSILMVRNAKGKNWIFPQGGFKDTDGALNVTVRRESFEEVGFSPEHFMGYELLLGQCFNEETRKLLFLLGMPVRRKGEVHLNKENDCYKWVNSFEQFQAITLPNAQEHWLKYLAMLDAIDLLHEQKQLRWSTGGHLSTASNSNAFD